MLARLQARADPPGLFARSLAECLRLQAADAGELDPVMVAVLDRLETPNDTQYTANYRIATKIGPEAIHRFLGEVFRLASDPIDDHRGEVHQYVGDEIVITWPVAEGRPGARPLACFFAIEQAIGQAEAYFLREFGAAPRLRAALHAGPVISGEVGGSRRAIVYHGDVMNTTSRIEQATRDLGRSFLVSGD